MKLAPEPLEKADEYPLSPSDAYGIRYARRKLVMPKGMMRGTFDVVAGRVSNENTATFNFGAAVSPAKYVEVGFSGYRMGSYPNFDVLRALGGNGLIPIVAQGRDLIPVGSTHNRAFGDIFAAFSRPILGTVEPRGTNTDIWTITVGTNLYSSALF